MNTKYVVIASEQNPIRIAGTFSVGERETLLFLNLLPGIRFFVTNDEKDSSKLRIFSGRSTRPGTKPYFNQVGSGKYISQIEAYELFFPDLGKNYYVYLKPDPSNQRNIA